MPHPPPAGDPASAGAQLERLVAIMRILRAADGCPWDREQTLATLRPFVLEEACEVVEALDADDRPALRDELGDYVFEAVFVAQLCAEDVSFTLADALRSAAEKLVRRHPHVFAADATTEDVRTADDVKTRWEAIKATEPQNQGRAPRLLGGLPAALPALLRAYRMGRRASTVCFDWTDIAGVHAKVDEELAELREAIGHVAPDPAAVEEELGDLLFAVANLARHLGVEPEGALRRANAKVAARFDELERRLTARGRALREASADELDAEWNRVKAAEAQEP